MIARLGDFLRLKLEYSERQFVTLKEEIEIVRCYLEIEQVRFSDRLQIEFDVSTESILTMRKHTRTKEVMKKQTQLRKTFGEY